MAGTIFISYRRRDDPDFVKRLHGRLQRIFGKKNVFCDVENIVSGDDFAKSIETGIGAADIVLVVIGDKWLTGDGHDNRLRDPDDFVRREVVMALERGKVVVPVIVQQAEVPRASDLPEKMRSLADKQAMFARHGGSDDEIDKLVAELKGHLRAKAARNPSKAWSGFKVAALVIGAMLALAIVFKVIELIGVGIDNLVGR